MTDTPPRRWFAFRLRTLFVLMVILSIPLAWIAHAQIWMRKRHALFSTGVVQRSLATTNSAASMNPPGGLWLFGEPGDGVLFLQVDAPNAPSLREVQAAFPEARILTRRYVDRLQQ